MKTYSILLAWHDNDPEQGEFGATVRAESPEEAEKLARREMWFASNDEEPTEDDVNSTGGRVVDWHEGAMWRAHDLETCLRGLLDNEPHTLAYHEARTKALALIKEIENA